MMLKIIHFWRAECIAQTWTSVSRVDDSEPRHLLHSGSGYLFSGLAGLSSSM